MGFPNLSWAYESHTDMIARDLGVDPVEFRRRNLLREGKEQATGTVMPDNSIAQVLDRLAERMNWSAAFARGHGVTRYGRGVAIGFKAVIAPTTSVATITINADGSCILNISTVDMGQGSDTVMAQIAAEVLGIPAQSIKVSHPDTDLTPYDMGTVGSRSTFHMGNAVKLAAEDARDKIAALAREIGLTKGSNYPLERTVPKTVRNASRQYYRCGNVHSTLCGTEFPIRPFDKCYSLLDGRRHRRGGRG